MTLKKATMTEKEIELIESTCSEAVIQHTCVAWFRKTFPHLKPLLFAVPNGGWRGARAGKQMVYEGQLKGVSDLILLPHMAGITPLCIEMKVPKKKGSSAGRQSEEQKAWQSEVESFGNKYVICHGLIEFVSAVCTHLTGVDVERYITEAKNKFPLYR